jgi:putative transposase
MKDRLWSIDVFRCESLCLQTHWVLVVMDQFTRRIIGFGIHRGIVDGLALCRMFQRAIRGQSAPKYLSTDNDPLYRSHQWQANLRVLDVVEIKTVPFVPWSHPFIERLIGTIRRECLDRTLFWTTADLEAKLQNYQHYYNQHRRHYRLDGLTPVSNGPTSPLHMHGGSIVAGCIRRPSPRDFMNSRHTRWMMPRVEPGGCCRRLRHRQV